MSITDILDLIRQEVAVEYMLRGQASIEYANGITNGAMSEAHKVSVENVKAAARQLIGLSQDNGKEQTS